MSFAAGGTNVKDGKIAAVAIGETNCRTWVVMGCRDCTPWSRQTHPLDKTARGAREDCSFAERPEQHELTGGLALRQHDFEQLTVAGETAICIPGMGAAHGVPSAHSQVSCAAAGKFASSRMHSIKKLAAFRDFMIGFAHRIMKVMALRLQPATLQRR